MEIIRKKLKEWDAETIKILYNLTNEGEESSMKFILETEPEAESFVVFKDEVIVGWGSVSKINHIEDWERFLKLNIYTGLSGNIFVREDFRRQGIGNFILRTIKKYYKEIRFYGWNIESINFYKSVDGVAMKDIREYI